MALGRQPRRHPARAVIRPGQVLPIDQRHDRAVLLADLGRLAVHRERATPPATGIAAISAVRGSALDQSAPFRPAHLPSFRDKKSFSTFSWPICRNRRSTCAALAVSSAPAPPPSKTLAAPSSTLLLPGVDLVRVNPIRARQLGHRPVAFDRRQRHLRFERRCVLLACLLYVLLPRHRRFLGAELHLNLRLVFGVQLRHGSGSSYGCVDVYTLPHPDAERGRSMPSNGRSNGSLPDPGNHGTFER